MIRGYLFPALLGAALALVSYQAGQRDALDNGPRLIGHGCEGAGGDIWAADESDFPTPCQAIERSR